MKILFVYQYFQECGGAERVLFDLQRQLEFRGHDVRVTGAFVGSGIQKLVSAPLQIGSLSKSTSWRQIIYNPLRWISIAARLVSHLKWADLVMAQNYPAHIWVHLASLLCRKRTKIWFCHEPLRILYEDRIPAPGQGIGEEKKIIATFLGVAKGLLKSALFSIMRYLDQAAAKKFDRIIFNSGFSKRSFCGIYRTTSAHVCPLGITAVPVQPGRGDPKNLLILNVTRLFRIKNVHTTLHALLLLQRERQLSEWEYHVCGDGPESNSLRRLAAELGLSHKVFLHGFVSDQLLHQYYTQASIFFSIPIGEPFGLTFVEAAMYGIPCIGPDQGGPSEIVVDQETGFCVSPQNPKRAAELLAKLGCDPNLRERMGRAAQLRYQENYSIERFTDRLTRLLMN